MALDVRAVDHLYVSVSDLARSEAFYDRVLAVLGFRKGTRPIAGEPHLHYFNRVMQYTLRPARTGTRADAYAVGAVHHLCFSLADRAAVDEAARQLRAAGVEPSEPALYPEYRPDYYATFFEDPDGIRLEVMCDTAGRKLIRERWAELTDFVDPVPKLLERDAAAAADGGRPPAAADSTKASIVGNLYRDAAPARGERFELLAQLGATRVERILSSAEPGLEPYVQPQDEWVSVLRGSAVLEFDGRAIALGPGDHLTIPAGTPHRVLSTTANTLWLAVHVPKA